MDDDSKQKILDMSHRRLYEYVRWLTWDRQTDPITLGRQQGIISAATDVLFAGLDECLIDEFLTHEKLDSQDIKEQQDE